MWASKNGAATRPLVVLDEVDAVATDPTGQALFAALRELTDGTWQGVVVPHFLLIGVRPPTHLVQEGSLLSDFAVGDDILWLDDFVNDNSSQMALVAGFPEDLSDQAPTLAWKALEFSGGYPQACTWLCDSMIRYKLDASLADLDRRLLRLVDEARRSDVPPNFLAYPQQYLMGYAQGLATAADPDPRKTTIEALWVYLDLARQRAVEFDPTAVAHQLLRWSGLGRRDQEGMLRTRSPMTTRLFGADWSRQLRSQIELLRGSTKDSRRRRSVTLPRVVLINTGGTIGMLPDRKSGKVLPAGTADEILQHFGEIRDVANVEYLEVLGQALDSANVTPEHWKRLGEAIGETLDRDDVEGIVVAHGTDTLAYTSSAVAFALGSHLDRPVVFTASQTTVQAVHGDARSNLVRACMVAGTAGRGLPEVVILFGDRVFRACRAQKVDDRRFDAFDSPFWPPLARVTQKLDIDHGVVRSIPDEIQPLEVRADFDDRILFIPQVPGLRASVLDRFLQSTIESGDIQGIIIQSLGAGNLPTVEPYSLVGFVERAIDQDVPVVLGSRFPISIEEPNRYEPSAAALRAGAIPLFNMTEAALLTKFAWVLGQMNHEAAFQSRTEWVSRRIMSDYVGEVDPSGLEGLYRSYQSNLRTGLTSEIKREELSS